MTFFFFCYLTIKYESFDKNLIKYTVNLSTLFLHNLNKSYDKNTFYKQERQLDLKYRTCFFFCI